MSLADLLLGRPLATEEEKAERIGPGKGIPIFGLDALSSAAYGPEAALTLLIPLGMAGVAYIWPISLSIVALLAIVYFSYRQTIVAYPQAVARTPWRVRTSASGQDCLRRLRSWSITYLQPRSESRLESERWSQLCLHCNPIRWSFAWGSWQPLRWSICEESARLGHYFWSLPIFSSSVFWE